MVSHMPDSNKKLELYFARERNRIEGWFGRIDAEIFRALLSYQANYNLRGSIAEIGVHHGKSFIGLCLSLQEGERAYCVDVFEDQHLNIDGSGRGNRQAFEENLRQFGVDLARLTIRSASSLDVRASEIMEEVGLIRFFSIDGGHWADVVLHDLGLAEASLVDYGIIALDDFHRPEWPDVSAGYFSWVFARKRALVPFCIGFNKLYLCGERWRQQYQSVVLGDPFLRYFVMRIVKFQGVDVPVLSEFLVPEHGFLARRWSQLRLFRPKAYVQLRRICTIARKLASKLGRTARHFRG